MKKITKITEIFIVIIFFTVLFGILGALFITAVSQSPTQFSHQDSTCGKHSLKAITIKSQENMDGSFFLFLGTGAGDIKNEVEQKYYFYSDDDFDGGYSLHSVSTKFVKIYEIDGSPYAEYCVSNYVANKYKLYIPKGSIYQSYNLDIRELNKKAEF